jgi:hypothetical protein
MLDPALLHSTTESLLQEPNRLTPCTDIVDPSRTKERIDRELPIKPASMELNAEPMRAKERTDKLLPQNPASKALK